MLKQFFVIASLAVCFQSSVYAVSVTCPNHYGSNSPEVSLVKNSDSWSLKMGPLLDNQARTLFANLPLSSLDNLPEEPSLVMTFSAGACELSNKGEATFSCEGGWGGGSSPVSYPISLVDSAGKEFAHFMVSSTIVDLQFENVSVPRVGHGDVNWQNFRLSFNAIVDSRHQISINDVSYEPNMGSCRLNK